MDMARLNFSHGEHANHQKTFEIVRAEANKRGRAVAILADLQGPKIRVGRFEEGAVELVDGAPFVISSDPDVVGTAEKVSTTYRDLPNDVSPGDELLLDDGYLQLTVTDVSGSEVHTRVVRGGTLKNNKGINLPGVTVSAPCLTEKDLEDLAFAVRLGVEYVALSFVHSAEDVRQAQALAAVGDQRIPVIAKIERPGAVENLDEIIDVADGLMVARGDLGVELGPEKVPLVQKSLIERANRAGKLVITATQMLESMIHNARPTRAEASDVANAILDGTDAVMLSGETAVGAYPNQTVRTMSRIVEEIESSTYYRHNMETPILDLPVSTNAIAHAAVIASLQMHCKTIVCVSESGGAARLMSEYRPEAEILALTSHESTFRRLAPYWGVEPILISPASSTDEMIGRIEAVLKERRAVEPGTPVVITMGVPVGAGISTNMLRVHLLS